MRHDLVPRAFDEPQEPPAQQSLQCGNGIGLQLHQQTSSSPGYSDPSTAIFGISPSLPAPFIIPFRVAARFYLIQGYALLSHESIFLFRAQAYLNDQSLELLNSRIGNLQSSFRRWRRKRENLFGLSTR